MTGMILRPVILANRDFEPYGNFISFILTENVTKLFVYQSTEVEFCFSTNFVFSFDKRSKTGCKATYI